MKTKLGFFLLQVMFLIGISSSAIKSGCKVLNVEKIVQTQDEGNSIVVKQNESLWKLAGRFDIYNNPFAWPVLYKANRTLIKNPNSMIAGLKIKTPALLPEEKIKYDEIRENYFRTAFFTTLQELLKKSKQILIVTSKEWESKKAHLIYYEKKKGKLLKMSDTISVNLGRSGLGWGSGLINFNTSLGPQKHEGDGRSPAGIFRLSSAFGFLPADSLSWLGYPYKQITSKIECVDDTASTYYNTIVDAGIINKTWTSSEKMREEEVAYKFGIIVNHNSNPRIQGCGSCIFIHIWGSPEKSTSGCTAMSESQLVKLLHWLDAKKKPLLIQLPEHEFSKIKSVLNL